MPVFFQYGFWDLSKASESYKTLMESPLYPSGTVLSASGRLL